MNSLRKQQEDTQEKCEELQSQVKKLQDDNNAKGHEIDSLQHRLQLRDAEVDKLERDITETKAAVEESGQHSREIESLHQKIYKMEEESTKVDAHNRSLSEQYDQSLCNTEKRRVDFFFLVGLVRSESKQRPEGASSMQSGRLLK